MYEDYAREIAALKLQNNWSWLLGIDSKIIWLLLGAFVVILLVVAQILEKANKKILATGVGAVAVLFGISLLVLNNVSGTYREKVAAIKDKYDSKAELVPKYQKVPLYPLNKKITKGFSENDLKRYVIQGTEAKYIYVTKEWFGYHKQIVSDELLRKTPVTIVEANQEKKSYLKIVRYEYKDKRFNKILEKYDHKEYLFYVTNFDKDVLNLSGEEDNYRVLVKENKDGIWLKEPEKAQE